MINKAVLVGRLGKDPERKQTRDGKTWATVSLATSKKWGGEERTTWHNIVVWSEGTANYLCDYARKGTMIYVEGEIQNRKYTDKDGIERYTTDIAVQPYSGELKILVDGIDRQSSGDRQGSSRKNSDRDRDRGRNDQQSSLGYDDMDDEIPF